MGTLPLPRVVPNRQRELISECITVAKTEGRSRTFVHAAIISDDIRVVVKHPSELETVLGGSSEKSGESDEIITAQELSRLTLRYEEVYKNFYHAKTCLDELQVSHYVIRRNLSIGEFDLVQYEEDGSIVLERRSRGLIERLFGNDKAHIPATALIIVADLLMQFVPTSAPCSPRRTRSHSEFSPRRGHGVRDVMYEIELGDTTKNVSSPRARPHFSRGRVVSISDSDSVLSQKRVRFTRSDSLKHIHTDTPRPG